MNISIVPLRGGAEGRHIIVPACDLQRLLRARLLGTRRFRVHHFRGEYESVQENL